MTTVSTSLTSLDRLRNELLSAPRAKRRLYAAAFASLVLGATSLASAGNDEGVPIGNRAALTGGAATASAIGAGAVWYNPAGLVLPGQSDLEANVSVYGLDLWSSQAAIVAPDGTTAPTEFVNWKLVPSSFAIVKEINPSLNASFSILVPYMFDTVSQAQAASATGELISSDILTGSSYYFGLSLGWKASDRLRFGATVFGMYSWTYWSTLLAAYEEGGDQLGVSYLLSESRYGLRMNAGAQWDVVDAVTLGLSVMSPSYMPLTTADRTSLVNGNVDGENVYESEVSSSSTWKGASFDPLKVRFGVLVKPHTKWEIEGDVSVSLPNDPSPISAEAAELEENLGIENPNRRNWLVNGSVGALYRYSDETAFAAGLFTDLNPWTNRGLDFAGLTIGYSPTKIFELKSGSKIRLASTLGGRYAYGRGASPVVDASVDGEESARREFSRTVVHELSLNVGTTLQF